MRKTGDFWALLEDDESLTDGKDLQLLLGGELNEDDDNDTSWEANFSSSEVGIDGTSIEEDSTAGGFLRGGSSGDDEETDDVIGYSSDSGGDDGSDASAAPPIKRRKVSSTYLW
jgi:hypothetical protein